MKDYWVIPNDAKIPIHVWIDGKQFYDIEEAYDYVSSLGFDDWETDTYIQNLPQRATP